MTVIDRFYHIEITASRLRPSKAISLNIIFLLLLCSLSVNAALPERLQKVGDGTMSWLFLDIYDASLFSFDGRYISGQYPQALTINYLKNIKRKKLINATKEQWNLQNIENKHVKYWLQSLDKIWPDIKKGDSLTFYVAENKKGYFYLNESFLGGINSEAFSEAFLAIWLSEKTSQPQLRQKLLGL